MINVLLCVGLLLFLVETTYPYFRKLIPQSFKPGWFLSALSRRASVWFNFLIGAIVACCGLVLLICAIYTQKWQVIAWLAATVLLAGIPMVIIRFSIHGVPGINAKPDLESLSAMRQQLNKQRKRKGKAAWTRSYSSNGGVAWSGEPWPSPQDFAEAIQNPHVVFSDADLRRSTPDLNSMGLPNVASGAFASVFKLSDGAKQWALRCFNVRVSDQHERYAAISKFVLTDDLSYTADFNYISEGIKHSNVWYPVLKMDWVSGEPLDVYVQRHLHNSSNLERLRCEFAIMMRELRNNGIAHGDLQHGNILVDDDSMYLVDYDGMYVPELQGLQSSELGHRNYQHPNRQACHFGPYLDNFSAWLIDISLMCLTEDPCLWDQFSGGDECLLFRQSDLIDPDSSRLFRALSSHSLESIQRGAELLKSFIQMPVQEVPFLGDNHSSNPNRSALTTGKESVPFGEAGFYN
jgi:hypothetical protein